MRWVRLSIVAIAVALLVLTFIFPYSKYYGRGTATQSVDHYGFSYVEITIELVKGYCPVWDSHSIVWPVVSLQVAGILLVCAIAYAIAGAINRPSAPMQSVPISTEDIASVTEAEAISLLKEETANRGVCFAERRDNSWRCVCGRENPLDESRHIQNCAACHTNRDFALKNWTEDAICRKVAELKADT